MLFSLMWWVVHTRRLTPWHKSSAVALMLASTATCGSVASSSSFLLIPERFSDVCCSGMLQHWLLSWPPGLLLVASTGLGHEVWLCI